MEEKRLQAASENESGLRSGESAGGDQVNDRGTTEGRRGDADPRGSVRETDQAGGEARVAEEEFQKSLDRERILKEFQKCGIKDGYSDELIQSALEFDPGYAGLQRAECYTLGGLNHGRSVV